MKFYLAASREKKELAAEVIQELIRRGHVCVYNWTEHFALGYVDPTGAAEDCLAGVRAAEVVIGLLPAETPGTNFEIGFAVALGRSVVLLETGPRMVVIDGIPRSVFDPITGHIFYHLPGTYCLDLGFDSFSPSNIAAAAAGMMPAPAGVTPAPVTSSAPDGLVPPAQAGERE